MDPREHVADVSRGIVCVQLDRAGKTVGTAASECVEKGGEDGGLASGSEGLQGVSAVSSVEGSESCRTEAGDLTRGGLAEIVGDGSPPSSRG